MSLTTAARVKSILGLAAGTTFHDIGITAAVDGANAWVLRRLGQTTLAVTTSNEYPEVYGAGQETILLKHAPIVGMGVLTNNSSAVLADDYRVDTEVGKIRLKGRRYFSEERDSVVVQYGWGYDANTIPAELVRAAELIAVSSFNKAPNSGVTSKSTSGYQIVLRDEDIPPEARSILAYYEDRHHS